MPFYPVTKILKYEVFKSIPDMDSKKIGHLHTKYISFKILKSICSTVDLCLSVQNDYYDCSPVTSPFAVLSSKMC